MKFFIPDIEDDERAEEIYQGIVSFAKETMGWNIGSSRIYKIAYRHDGKDHIAEVGKSESINAEVVLAILDSKYYLVCTPKGGCVKGIPVLVGGNEVYHVTEFDG